MREFWGLWLRAALVIAIAAAFYLHLPAARAATMRPHAHHDRPVRHWHRRSARDAMLVHSYGALGRQPHGRDAVAIAMRYLGSSNPTGSHRAWCGDFVNMTERLAGRPGMASGALASAWRSYGHATGPVRGAIAVMRGHVSRVIARAGGGVWLISGNWSKHVKVHFARLSQVLAFRTL